MQGFSNQVRIMAPCLAIVSRIERTEQRVNDKTIFPRGVLAPLTLGSPACPKRQRVSNCTLWTRPIGFATRCAPLSHSRLFFVTDHSQSPSYQHVECVFDCTMRTRCAFVHASARILLQPTRIAFKTLTQKPPAPFCLLTGACPG